MSITAMKQALEALEVASSCVDGYYIPKGKTHLPEVEKAITSLKQAIAEAEKREAYQKPVAWMSPSWIDPDTRGWQSDSFESIPIQGWLPVYTFPPQCQPLTVEKLREHWQVAKDALKAIAEAEQEPVAWLITDEKINHLQVESIQRLIDRARHAHHTDICLRINGKDEWFQADWLKHLTRTTPPQRTEQEPVIDKSAAIRIATALGWEPKREWVGLTRKEVHDLWVGLTRKEVHDLYDSDYVVFHQRIEAKLKEKNT